MSPQVRIGELRFREQAALQKAPYSGRRDAVLGTDEWTGLETTTGGMGRR